MIKNAQQILLQYLVSLVKTNITNTLMLSGSNKRMFEAITFMILGIAFMILDKLIGFDMMRPRFKARIHSTCSMFLIH